MLTKMPRQQSLVLHRNFENSIFFFLTTSSLITVQDISPTETGSQCCL